MNTRFFSLLAFFISVTLFWGCGAPGPQAVSENNLPEKVELTYSWVGAGPISTRELYELKLNKDHRLYDYTGVMSRSSSDKTFETHGQCPTETLIQVLHAVKQVQWEQTSRPTEIITHANDYPNRAIWFHPSEGRSFKLISTSNTPQGSPWNIYWGESIYKTTDTNLGNSLQALYSQVTEDK